MTLLWRILFSFLKVGLFGYGGGPSMIPLLQEEVVELNGWLSAEEFVDALAMGNSLPGPIIIKMATFVGYKLAGLPGLISAVLGVSLPGLLLMLLMTLFFFRFKDHPKVQAVLRAVRPMVVALLAVTIYSVWPAAIRHRWDSALIAVTTFLAVTLLNVHPAFAILGAAILGYIVY
ncbi:MAG TPA: chromate transporter [Anaerolineae bacterium]|nr:chromate transporter [Anaerolineae bacterium]